MSPLVYVGYVVLSALVVFLSVKLGKYVDLLDKKTNISGAFIGGVLLAAVTSLPELFTSISSVLIVHQNQLVVGNVLGSNLINLAFFGVIMLVFTKKFKNSRFSQHYIGVLLAICGVYGVVALALYFSDYLQLGWFNVLSPIIFVVYVLVIMKTPKTSEGEEETTDTLTVKQIVVRFVICAVVLIGASIGITYLAEMIANSIGMNRSFAGALFLGIATSLPELVSSITLCMRGNFDASAGNIIGSNMFNFIILFLADLISFQKGYTNMYIPDRETMYLMIFGVIASIAIIGMLAVKRKNDTNKIKPLVACQTLNAVPVVCYVVFIALSSLGI